MSEYVSSRQIAEIWGISPRRVSKMCKEGRIPGAKKDHNAWIIPQSVVKPVDRRRKADSSSGSVEQALFPVGITDFVETVSRYYYVDKSLLIKEILDDGAKAILITRPRRFGKSLNADMVRVFFEKSDRDTSVYFKHLKIWHCGEKYKQKQGRYPVIFLSLRGLDGESWEKTYRILYQVLRDEFLRHPELRKSKKLLPPDRDYYARIVDGKASEDDVNVSLARLSRMLFQHHEEKAIIIIDEYDVPIQYGYLNGYYDQATNFIRRLFSMGLKDNSYLEFGFLTGILRVAKESIFSGLNNLQVYTVLDERFSQYFGFTRAEVMAMAEYYGHADKMEELCSWYDGYRFGSEEIFNPWSVISYFKQNCDAQAYWNSTSGNDLINTLLPKVNQSTAEKLCSLIQGQAISARINTNVVYPSIGSSPDVIFSFLLMAGYLKPTKRVGTTTRRDAYCLEIPNREIEEVYREEVLSKVHELFTEDCVSSIDDAILAKDAKRLQAELRSLLLASASFFDTVGENFYQGLMLGLCAAMKGYRVTSNRESGEGRYDLCLEPISKNLPAFLIELKACSSGDSDKLKQLAQDALTQIQEKKYAVPLMDSGIQAVVCFGVAFSGKMVEADVLQLDTGERSAASS